MIKNTLGATALVLAMPLVLLIGCTQMPTEKQSVSDMRPQISFKAPDSQRHSARVLIDGLDMGTVGSYLDGTASLRIISGTHQLRIMQGIQLLLEENFYVGDGVNRHFNVQ